MEHYTDELQNNEPSLHEKMACIKEDADKKRKKQLSRRISVGDRLFKGALIIAFAGFWVFWLLVVLSGV